MYEARYIFAVLFLLFAFLANGEQDNVEQQLCRRNCQEDEKIERILCFKRSGNAESRRHKHHHKNIRYAHPIAVGKVHKQCRQRAQERYRPKDSTDNKRLFIPALIYYIYKCRQKEKSCRQKSRLSAAGGIRHMREIKHYRRKISQNGNSSQQYIPPIGFLFHCMSTSPDIYKLTLQYRERFVNN